MGIVQQHRELMQRRVAKTFRLDRFHGCQHIVAVDAGRTVPLQHMAQLVLHRQPPGILHMAAVHHIGERTDALARLVLQPHRTRHLAIDRGDLLALAQISDGGGAVLFGDPKRDAAAGAAAIEAEHETGLFRRSPVHEGIDAKRAVFADQPGRDLFDEFKTRPPHQRAIAEYPEVALEFLIWEDNRRHYGERLAERRAEFHAFNPGSRPLTFDKIVSQRAPMTDNTFAPRRRPLWGLFIVPVLVLIAAAAWSAFWFYAASQAGVRADAWRAQEAKSGRVYDCAKRTVAGFPFRFE